MRFDVTTLLADGDVVMTERVDTFVVGDMEVVIPVAGVFELSGGKIAVWRDYFRRADGLIGPHSCW